MAAPTDSVGEQPTASKGCFIHFPGVDEKTLHKFTETSWSRVLECVQIWKSTDNKQGKIAANFVELSRPSNTVRIDSNSAIVTAKSNDTRPSYSSSNSSDIKHPLMPQGAKFHRRCYQKFTDKEKIDRAQRKKRKGERQTEQHEHEEPYEEPQIKKRRGRSSSAIENTSGQRSPHILPPQCIVCQGNKYTCNKSKGTRVKEALASCELIDGGRLVQQAKLNNDVRILRQVRGKDCVAIELKYHLSCLREYTRPLYHTEKQPGTSYRIYDDSFNKFCEEVIERQVIREKAVLKLTSLKKMFVKTVHKEENQDARSYKTHNLKQRLQAKYPELKFLRPKKRNHSEMVYVDDLSAENLLTDNKCSPFEQPDTDTTDTTDSENDVHFPPTTIRITATLGERYSSALDLKKEIDAVPLKSMPWPPTSTDLTLDAAETLIPVKLFNFLAWMTGLSSEPEDETFVEVTDDKQRRLLSLAQDIVYLASNGRKPMPKQTSLAMAVRHLSGSAQLIGLLNGFGHATSHTAVLEHDTALAKKELQLRDTMLPSCLQEDIFTTVVWDNNDFGEETLSGKGTTHNTNGIAIQHEPAPVKRLPVPTESMKKTRERSLEAVPQDLIPFFGMKKADPKSVGVQTGLQKDQHTAYTKNARHEDFGYFITKCPVSNIHPLLPGWTGFNQSLTAAVPPKATIAYLPVIDATPTDLSTVNTILHRSIDVANSLKLDTIAVVVDQAIYAKAQTIRWQTPLFMDRIVIRLGAFHAAMTFLACIGKRFRDAGFEDVLIESEVLAPGSANGVMNGRQYNRSLRCHKVMLEALSRLRWKAFVQTQSQENVSNYEEIILKLQKAFPTQEYLNIVNSVEFRLMRDDYGQFISNNKTNNATFAFWCSYMDMVETLLQFIRSSREGNWLLHLSAIRMMLPWMFACDRHNYARYLPIYWMEMQDLPNSHPAVHAQFLKGNFVVQRQDMYGFAGIPCDQTIEQTINRDSKTRGGLRGFTVNKGAVNRWTAGHHERAAITRQCEEMAGKGERATLRKDLSVSRMTRDEKDVNCIIETISNLSNPFEGPEVAPSDIIHIASGAIASTEVAKDLLTAEEKGDEAFVKYCEERLQKEDRSIRDTLPKLRLKTFTDMSKTVLSKVKGKEVALKSDRDLFARLVIIGKVRNINLQNLMTYSLGPLPLAIAKSDGCLVKTNKAKLLHVLEDLQVDDTDVRPHPSREPPKGGVWIIDAMALLQQLSQKSMPQTFGKLSEKVFKQLINIGLKYQSQWLHFVTDTYPAVSVKNAERRRRAACGAQKLQIRKAEQNTPKQWKKFLSDSHNKQQLVRFLFSEWQKYGPEQLHGIQLAVAHDGECHSIFADKDGVMRCEPINELFCDHEEADTRMFLHARYISQISNGSPIIIRSPDTDVLVIAVALSENIPSQLYFHTGREDNVRTVDVGAVSKQLGDVLTGALIGFHCFTGCDSVSSFFGKGKQKAMKLLQKNPSYAALFKELGVSLTVSEELFTGLEKYTCLLYGHKELCSVNEVRYIMLKTATRTENIMPPNQDSLRKHILRANFQASVFKKSLVQYQGLQSPVGNGWKMEGDDLTIDWMELAPAPESVLELSFCRCRGTKCKPPNAEESCCASLGLRCTDLCECRKCENIQFSTYFEEEADCSDDVLDEDEEDEE